MTIEPGPSSVMVAVSEGHETPAAAQVPRLPADAQNTRDIVYVLGQIGGTLSIVIGALAILLALIPFLNFAALVMAVWGLCFGFLGGGFLFFGQRGRLLLPLLGIALNVGAFIVFVAVYVLLFLLALASG